MCEEDRVDVARIDTDPAHVRQQRRSAIEEQAAIHHHGPVVTIRRKGGACAEERDLYAMVTDGLRYTS
jgi:hypothetical protein